MPNGYLSDDAKQIIGMKMVDVVSGLRYRMDLHLILAASIVNDADIERTLQAVIRLAAKREEEGVAFQMIKKFADVALAAWKQANIREEKQYGSAHHSLV